MPIDKKKSLKYILLAVFFIAILLSIVLLVIGGVFLFTRVLVSTEERVTLKSLRYDPNSKESTYGFISLPKYKYDSLNETKSVSQFSFTESDGSFVLLSQMNQKEYTCTGSCYCKNGERRMLPTALSYSLYALISGITVSMAFYHAKKYFGKRCHETHASTCVDGEIEAIVDECRAIEDVQVLEFESQEYPDFICNGNCLPEITTSSKSESCKSVEYSRMISINRGEKKDCNGYNECKKLAIDKFNSETSHFCELSSTNSNRCRNPKSGEERKNFFHCLIHHPAV